MIYQLNGTTYLLVVLLCIKWICNVSCAPIDGIQYSGTFLRSEEPVPRGCLYQDQNYQHGEMVRTPQPCLNCTCARGMLLCFLRVCPLLSSPSPGCFTARKDGDCCPSFICSSDNPPGVSNDAITTTLSELEENETLPPDDYFQPGETITPSYYTSSINIPDFSQNETSMNQTLNNIVNDTTAVVSMVNLVAHLNNHSFNESSVIVTSTAPSSFIDLEGDFDFNHLNVIKGGCFINGSLYAEGSAIISGSFCEYCYCIRAKAMCIKPKCHLSIDNCKPKYSNEYYCCPTSYSCKKNATIATTTTTMTSTSLAPKILNKACEYEGRKYYMGEPIMSVGNCQNCFCTEHGVKCKSVECSPVLEGCVPIIPDGHCCPVEYSCNETQPKGDVSFHKDNDSGSKLDLDDSSSTIHNVSLETGETKDNSTATISATESSIYNTTTHSEINIIESLATLPPNYKTNFVTDQFDLILSETTSPPIVFTESESVLITSTQDTNNNDTPTEGESKLSITMTTQNPNDLSTPGQESSSFNYQNIENETHGANYNAETTPVTLVEVPYNRNSDLTTTNLPIEETEDNVSSRYHEDGITAKVTESPTSLEPGLLETTVLFKNEATTISPVTEISSLPTYPGLILKDMSTESPIQTIESTLSPKLSNKILHVNEDVKVDHVVKDMDVDIQSPSLKTSPSDTHVISSTREVDDAQDIPNEKDILVDKNPSPEYKDMSHVEDTTRENDRLIYFPEVQDSLEGFVEFRKKINESDHRPSSAQPIYKNSAQHSSTVPTKIFPTIQISGNGWKPMMEQPEQKHNYPGFNLPINDKMPRPQNSQFLPGNYYDPHSSLYYERPLELEKKKETIVADVPTGPVSYVPSVFERDYVPQGRISPGSQYGMPLYSNRPIIIPRPEIPEKELDDEDESPFGFQRRSGLVHEPESQIVMGRPRTKLDFGKPLLKEKVEIITASSIFDPNSDIDFGRHHLYDHEVKQSRSDSEMRVVSLKQVLKVSPEAAGRPGSVFSVSLNSDDGEAYFRQPQDTISKKVDTESEITYTDNDELTLNSNPDQPIRSFDPPMKKIVLTPKEPRPFKVIPFLAEDAVGQVPNDTRSIFVGPFPTPNPSLTVTEKTLEIKGGECFSNGRLYDNGEMMVKDDPCELCRCFYGRELCQKQTCPEPPSEDCLSEKVTGYCCPRFTCGTQGNVESTLTQSQSIPETHKVEVPSYVPTLQSTTTEPPYTYPSISDEIADKQVGALQHTYKQTDKTYEPENVSLFLTTPIPLASTKQPKRSTTLTIIKLKPTTITSTTTTTPSSSTTSTTTTIKPSPSRSPVHISLPNITKIKIMKPVRKITISTTNQPVEEVIESTTSPTTVKTTTVTKKTVESDNSVWGKLKVSGCNIFGKFYNLNDFVKDLSGPCNICICSSQGVECTPQC